MVEGPIVRINPRQVHINDPDFFEEIYAGGNRKRDKDPAFPPRLGMSLSVISTVGHDHHRVRRKILNNFFSKQSVTNLEPIMQEKVNKLATRLKEAYESKEVIHLEYAFAALTADVIRSVITPSPLRRWGVLRFSFLVITVMEKVLGTSTRSGRGMISRTPSTVYSWEFT